MLLIVHILDWDLETTSMKLSDIKNLNQLRNVENIDAINGNISGADDDDQAAAGNIPGNDFIRTTGNDDDQYAIKKRKNKGSDNTLDDLENMLDVGGIDNDYGVGIGMPSV